MKLLLVLVVVSVAVCSGAPSPRALPCGHYCYHSVSPVCGSDGRTYLNLCIFSVAQCQAQQIHKHLTVKHYGSCGQTTTALPSLAPVGNAHPCNEICDESHNPVCGSDGFLYENPCRFRAASCQWAREGLTLTQLPLPANGTCLKPRQADCGKYHVDLTDVAFEGPLGTSIKLKCPPAISFVCSTDGHSFSSECQFCYYLDHLKTAHGGKPPTVLIMHDGRCHSIH